MKFYYSDIHANHANIIKYCSRPFDTVDIMNEMILNSLDNSKLKEGDDLYFLGDFSFGSYDKVRAFGNRYVEILNKKKLASVNILFGNHDNHTTICDVFEKFHGPVTYSGYSEIRDGNTKVILCHYPIESWNGMNKGAIHLFGHVHASQYNNTAEGISDHHSTHGLKKIPGRYHVGVDEIGYAPRTLQEIMKGLH